MVRVKQKNLESYRSNGTYPPTWRNPTTSFAPDQHRVSIHSSLKSKTKRRRLYKEADDNTKLRSSSSTTTTTTTMLLRISGKNLDSLVLESKSADFDTIEASFCYCFQVTI